MIIARFLCPMSKAFEGLSVRSVFQWLNEGPVQPKYRGQSRDQAKKVMSSDFDLPSYIFEQQG